MRAASRRYHNLLAQVVGYKYIRIYDARHMARLSPRSGPQCNQSNVDLDNPQPQQHQLFARCEETSCAAIHAPTAL